MVKKVLREKISSREKYEKKWESFLGAPLIKVLVGMRRVGKSSLLKRFLQILHTQKKVSPAHIFYVNTELFSFSHLKNYDDLLKTFLEWKNQSSLKDGDFFVCAIDEIQQIESWEKFVNGLLAEYGSQVEIIITGSNASLLSGDLATLLSGRYVQIVVYPLSLTEFSQFSQKPIGKDLFLQHLQQGGLPGIFSLKSQESAMNSYLQDVYSTVVLKDIVQYFGVRNTDFLEKLYRFVLSNSGNIFSAKKISDYLKSQKTKISVETVLKYLSYAQDAFLLEKVLSQDPSSKKTFEIYQKYYSEDMGLRNAYVGFSFARDIGRLLENYVYLTLKSFGFEVNIGRLKSGKEIDFVAQKNGKISYFQVCYLLADEEVIEREYSSLEEVNDSWPKFVLSLDEMEMGVRNGIVHKKIFELEGFLEGLV